MYWSASSWIWVSISAGLRVEAMEMTLVITAEPDTATAARVALVPLRATAFWMAWPTASTSAIFFSTTALGGRGSTA